MPIPLHRPDAAPRRADPERFSLELPRGLTRETVEAISRDKKEPAWMREHRLRAFDTFLSLKDPEWGPDLRAIDFSHLRFYLRATDRPQASWADVPERVKTTFDKLGVPQAERDFLGGLTAQYESSAVYHSLKEDLQKQGILFTDMDTAVREHPDVVRQYFSTVVPALDNKYAALNTAVWSGGSFVYVPKGVKVDLPLQAYFRINAREAGQFERTLIVADEGSEVHYVEGCTAPRHSADALHAAVVEVIAKANAKLRYTTIQNWSSSVYNLVTKRAHAHTGSYVEWVDGNLGSKTTMKYPAVHLLGPGARADLLGVSMAGEGQQQDTGAKAIHLAPDTHSRIVSKSIAVDGGRSTFRGRVHLAATAHGSTASVQCDALLVDDRSRSDTYPKIDNHAGDATVVHEATAGRIDEDTLFYLRSRGLTAAEAHTLVVLGFIAGFTKRLPFEYAVELNRLVEMEMEGAVG